jgi:pimeloyl-ACP methyl ester carboxylesterase
MVLVQEIGQVTVEETMQHRQVNGYDMAYVEVGQGPPLLLVHGSLSDFRTWCPILGPLSRRHRIIAPSLRHFFPAHWDGVGDGFTMAQHVADVIGFIEASGPGPIDLLGHSRGGHVAFRVAQQRPELLRRLVLAEPGGDLDDTLASPGAKRPASLAALFAAAAKNIAGGDIEGGMTIFLDGLEGPGAWARHPESRRQQLRDNARTLLGQINENRQPFSLADAQSIRTPTLFIGGECSVGSLPVVMAALSANVKGARIATIPGATHTMHEQNPVAFTRAVLDFLA